MPTFRYRALTQTGEIVRGSLTAPTLAEVERRIAYLQLLPIEAVEESNPAKTSSGFGFSFNRPSAAEVTTFTRDLALLLKRWNCCPMMRMWAACGRWSRDCAWLCSVARASPTRSLPSLTCSRRCMSP
jgi:hypothetical protein